MAQIPSVIDNRQRRLCAASLREMWRRELTIATIAATLVFMAELGRDGFDPRVIGDANVLLIDESHYFRNNASKQQSDYDYSARSSILV